MSEGFVKREESMNSEQWNGLMPCAVIAIFSFVMTEILRSVYQMGSRDPALEQRPIVFSPRAVGSRGFSMSI